MARDRNEEERSGGGRRGYENGGVSSSKETARKEDDTPTHTAPKGKKAGVEEGRRTCFFRW